MRRRQVVGFAPTSGVHATMSACRIVPEVPGVGRPNSRTLGTLSRGLRGSLDSPRSSGNHLSMDQISPLSVLTQDEVRVSAWAEVWELLELQLAPLGRHALAALAPHPGESVLDIGCGGGETALDLARAIAPDGTGPSSAGDRCRRTRWTSCRSGPRPLICRRSLLTTPTRPARSRSPIPTACAAFSKERASGKSRLLPVTSWLEAATSMRCWRSVRGSELWARFFERTRNFGPRRYRQRDPRLRHTMDPTVSG